MVPRMFNSIPRIPSIHNPHHKGFCQETFFPPYFGRSLQRKMISILSLTVFSEKKEPGKLCLYFWRRHLTGGQGQLRPPVRTQITLFLHQSWVTNSSRIKQRTACFSPLSFSSGGCTVYVPEGSQEIVCSSLEVPSMTFNVIAHPIFPWNLPSLKMKEINWPPL